MKNQCAHRQQCELCGEKIGVGKVMNIVDGMKHEQECQTTSRADDGRVDGK